MLESKQIAKQNGSSIPARLALAVALLCGSVAAQIAPEQMPAAALHELPTVTQTTALIAPPSDVTETALHELPTVTRTAALVSPPNAGSESAAAAPAPLPDAPSHQAAQQAASSLAPLPDATVHVSPQSESHPALHPEDYEPLSAEQKFQLFVRHSYSPLTFLSAGVEAGYSQHMDYEPSLGQGLAGYGRRYGLSLATQESQAFLQKFFLPWMLKQDPRYFPSGEDGLARRVGYAVTRVIFTRTDAGEETFNSSRIVGVFAAKAAANTYRPWERRSPMDTLERVGVSLATDAGMNILREFWPHIRTRLPLPRR